VCFPSYPRYSQPPPIFSFLISHCCPLSISHYRRPPRPILRRSPQTQRPFVACVFAASSDSASTKADSRGAGSPERMAQAAAGERSTSFMLPSESPPRNQRRGGSPARVSDFISAIGLRRPGPSPRVLNQFSQGAAPGRCPTAADTARRLPPRAPRPHLLPTGQLFVPRPLHLLPRP